MSRAGVSGYGDDLEEKSHGESFLQVFAGRFNEPGLYLLDEPESGLAFEALLQLLIVLHHLAEIGGQIVCATHSPVLTALPDASILELSEKGISRTTWEQLGLVQNWQDFLTSPETFIYHLLQTDTTDDPYSADSPEGERVTAAKSSRNFDLRRHERVKDDLE